jgi:hypothetical protein
MLFFYGRCFCPPITHLASTVYGIAKKVCHFVNKMQLLTSDSLFVGLCFDYGGFKYVMIFFFVLYFR